MEPILIVPIQDDELRTEILAALESSFTPVTVEGDEVRLVIRVQRREENGDLFVTMAGAGAWPFRNDEELNVRFERDGHLYFMGATSKEAPGGALLSLKREEVSREQLRKHFRLVIPADYTASFRLTNQGGEDIALARILDLTPYGVGLEVPAGTLEFDIGDLLQGQLTLGRHRPLELAGTVRFAQGVAPDPRRLGIEFEHTIGKSEDRLHELLMFVRHDLFHRK